VILLEIRVFISLGGRARKAVPLRSARLQTRFLWYTALLLWSAPLLAQNLVQNAGFDSNLASWMVASNSSWTTSWESGTAKVRWVGPQTQSAYVPLSQGGMPVTPGVTYEFAVSARLDVEPNASLYSPVGVNLYMLGSNPNVPLDAKGDTFYGTGWVDLKGFLIAPNGSQTALLTLQIPGNAGQVATFDNASLRALPASAEFNAGPTMIASGEAVTLVWATASTPNVSIAPGVGSVARTGSVVVHPTETTTYTLTASGPIGTVTKQIKITVVPPPTATFSVAPTSISAGESATLSWTTTDAASVSIDNGVGSVAPKGSAIVSPTATTTYTLTANGIGGSATKQVTVTVTPPKPQITFTASPHTIAEGESSTLSWTVLNATSVSIDHSIGNRPTSGSSAVSPTATTTYRLTAAGPGGSSSAQVTVTVLAAPVIIFSATPSSITRGFASTLVWTVTDATLVVIDQGVGAQAPNGALEVRPTVTTTYLLTATGPGGARQAQVTITVEVSGRRRAVRH
jgi:hypothetical protein